MNEVGTSVEFNPTEKQLTEPNLQSENSQVSLLRRLRNGVAIGLIAGVSLFAGLKSGEDNDSVNTARTYAGKISGLPESQSAVLSLPSEEEAIQAQYEKDKSDADESILVIGADEEDTRQAYRNFYSNWGESPSINIPRLREAAYINNGDLFKEERQNSNMYPFSIYNATDYPLDLRFINYSLKSTNLWLEEMLAENDGIINIGGYANARVKPADVPHVTIFTNKYPDTLNEDYYSKGTTRKYPDYLSISFLVRDFPSNSDGVFDVDLPFRKRAIATEICQSLVDVNDVKPILGQKQTLEAQRIYWEKPEGQTGADLIGQEQICNSIGAVVTAIYEGGQEKLDDYRRTSGKKTKIGLAQVPRMDISIADDQISDFFNLKKQALLEENFIITDENSKLPTVAWYREKES